MDWDHRPRVEWVALMELMWRLMHVPGAVPRVEKKKVRDNMVRTIDVREGFVQGNGPNIDNESQLEL